VAHGRVKKQQQNNVFFKLRLNEQTGGEMRIFRGMAKIMLLVSYPLSFGAPSSDVPFGSSRWSVLYGN